MINESSELNFATFKMEEVVMKLQFKDSVDHENNKYD